MFVYFFFLLVQIKNKCDVFIFFLYYFLNSVFFFFCCVYKIIIMCGIDPVKVPSLPHMFLSFHGDEKKSLIRSAIFSTPNLYSQPHPFICLWLITLKKKSPFLFEFLFCLNFLFFTPDFKLCSYNLSCLITFYVLAY